MPLRNKRNPKNVFHLAVTLMIARGGPIKGDGDILFYQFVRLITVLLRGVISLKNGSQLSREREMNDMKRYLTHN